MSEQAEKLRELVRLHDEAFDALDDGYHKASEGAVTLHLTNRFDAERGTDALHIKGVEIYAYTVGPSRSHCFDSVDEALDAVRRWHAAAMAEVRDG